MKIAPGDSNVRLGLPVISDAAHTGLGITEDDWNVSVRHVVETLDKFKGPGQGKKRSPGRSLASRAISWVARRRGGVDYSPAPSFALIFTI